MNECKFYGGGRCHEAPLEGGTLCKRHEAMFRRERSAFQRFTVGVLIALGILAMLTISALMSPGMAHADTGAPPSSPLCNSEPHCSLAATGGIPEWLIYAIGAALVLLLVGGLFKAWRDR